MLLDYSSSTVGPYRELLYIPGRVSLRAPMRAGGHSISKIFVTTEVSRASGEENWGIPKLLGDIRWETRGEMGEEVTLLNAAGRLVLTIRLPHQARGTGGRRAISIPFSHRFLPRTLLQTAQDRLYSTSIEATGRFRPVIGARMSGHASPGEEIASRRIAAAFFLSEVQLRFPPPTDRIPIE